MSDTDLTRQPGADTAATRAPEAASHQGGLAPAAPAGASFSGKVARRLARKGVNSSLAPSTTAYGLSSYNYAPALKAVALSEVADSFAGASHAQMQADHGGSGPSAGPALKSASDVADHGFSGGGGEIPHRAAMESSFGMDFGHVKSYSGGPAAKANDDLGSHAYAMGNQIAFKSANPSPDLVAHELTHTIQQGGVAAHGGGDGGGIDTSGESEADAVESAVRSGQPAHTALSSSTRAAAAPMRKASAAGPALKRGPALEGGEGGGSKFGMGMTFSLEGFEKSYDYTIWKGHYAWPTPVPGLNFVIDPNVKVSGKGGIKYGGENKGDMYAQLGVFGEVGIGLSGGIPDVAEIYGTINPGIEGSFTLTKHGGGEAHGAEGHGAHAAEPNQSTPEPNACVAPPAGSAKSEWSMVGALTVKGAAKIGVSLAGGIVDQAFELGSIDICKLTGVYFDQTGFRKDKLGFKWGPKIKEAYEGLKKAIDKARNLGRAGIEAAKRAGQFVASGASQLAHWVTSW